MNKQKLDKDTKNRLIHHAIAEAISNLLEEGSENEGKKALLAMYYQLKEEL